MARRPLERLLWGPYFRYGTGQLGVGRGCWREVSLNQGGSYVHVKGV